MAMVILLLIDGNSFLNQAAITSVTMEDDGLPKLFSHGIFVESLFDMKKKTPCYMSNKEDEWNYCIFSCVFPCYIFVLHFCVTMLQRYQQEDEWNDHLWVPADESIHFPKTSRAKTAQRKPPSKNQTKMENLDMDLGNL